jgi:MFS family permease
VILTASFLTMAVMYGVIYAYPVFFVALVGAFGWSRASTASVFSVNMLMAGLSAPLVGHVVDRYGPRRVLPWGAVLLGTGLVLCATVQQLWHLWIAFGLVAALGSSILGPVTHTALLSNWFVRSRGSAIGIAFAGMGAGLWVFSPLSQLAIDRVGWRGTFACLGLLCMILLLPLVVLCQRDRPEELGLEPDGGRERVHTSSMGNPRPVETPGGVSLVDALRSVRFWGFVLCFFFTPVSMFAVTTHQVAHVVDLGFPTMTAVNVLGAVGLLSSVGRALFGVLSDRIGRVGAASASYVSSGVGILILLRLAPASPVGWLYLYALLFGIAFGARGPIVSAMTADAFRGRHYGTIFGLIHLSNGVGAALGPWMGGALYDATGSYGLAFGVALAAVGLACVSLWVAGHGFTGTIRRSAVSAKGGFGSSAAPRFTSTEQPGPTAPR